MPLCLSTMHSSSENKTFLNDLCVLHLQALDQGGDMKTDKHCPLVARDILDYASMLKNELNIKKETYQ